MAQLKLIRLHASTIHDSEILLVGQRKKKEKYSFGSNKIRRINIRQLHESHLIKITV